MSKKRKKQIKEIKISRNERRRQEYKKMFIEETLGTRDLKKYQQMYDYLRNKILNFNFPSVHDERLPKRPAYTSLRSTYNKYISECL